MQQLLPGLRSVIAPLRAASTRRCYSNSPFMKNAGSTATLPASKPVGAFRGGLFGFLTGSVVAGAAVYYYILGEYRVSNSGLTEDISALQTATQKLQTYISELETRVDQLQRKK
ncbi:hypothetical protein BDW66DRAFT_128431 [Aspergillus desertorum]